MTLASVSSSHLSFLFSSMICFWRSLSIIVTPHLVCFNVEDLVGVPNVFYVYYIDLYKGSLDFSCFIEKFRLQKCFPELSNFTPCLWSGHHDRLFDLLVTPTLCVNL